MHILVTGGNGFIGRHAVADMIKQGHTVSVISRANQALHPKANHIKADLLSLSQTAMTEIMKCGADALLLLAWETENGKFWHARSNANWCAQTIALSQVFLESGGRRIVAAGTCVEYNPPNDGPCLAKTTPISPNFPYSISKNSLHNMLSWMTENYDASYAWGRVFMAYGPQEHPRRLVPSIIKNLLSGQPAKCSSGKQVRDFMHSQDYGRAFSALTDSNFSGPLNICSGTPVSIAEVATMIGKIMERPDLIQLGALPDRPGEALNIWGENQDLTKSVGFKPTFSLETGLSNVISNAKAF